MLLFESPLLLRQQCRLFRQQGLSLALVPTMGHLHAGHLRLVEVAREQADVVVVSVFVNPMQFDQQDDLARYPRTLQQDCEQLSALAVDVVFAPQASALYCQGTAQQTFVEVPRLSAILEGASRPGHFRGVATVLCKLFNLVAPDTVCFGEKDYQQLHLVRRMVADLDYDIEVIGVPTVRDASGLALSSRNSLLSEQQRAIAPGLHQVMQQVARRLAQGDNEIYALRQFATEQLQAQGFHDVQVHIRDAQTLLPLAESSQHAVILLAARLGQTRLIDNLVQTLPDQNTPPAPE